MIKLFKEKLNIKWYEYIPIIGPMIYNVRINMFKSVQDKSFRSVIGKCKKIFDLVSFAAILSFMITFWVVRNTGSYGAYPWMVWAGVGIAAAINSTPFIAKLLYLKGLKTYEEKVKEGKIIEATPISYKGKLAEIDAEKAEKKKQKEIDKSKMEETKIEEDKK
ncbi:MAG: hypothetical protein KAG91_01190 [Mycoplasmataceae bacterium]|nr:hypothetical protein [Mycoplasmataceae bacterium]